MQMEYCTLTVLLLEEVCSVIDTLSSQQYMTTEIEDFVAPRLLQIDAGSITAAQQQANTLQSEGSSRTLGATGATDLSTAITWISSDQWCSVWKNHGWESHIAEGLLHASDHFPIVCQFVHAW